jgi:hypothetical protein
MLLSSVGEVVSGYCDISETTDGGRRRAMLNAMKLKIATKRGETLPYPENPTE